METWDGGEFRGSKIALFCGDQLLVYLRDDKPTIPYPGMWDLPGGGREGDEGPIDCALREVEEEFGIRMPSTAVYYLRRYESQSAKAIVSYFCAAEVSVQDIDNIVFGDEGQFWQLVSAEAFLTDPLTAPTLPNRLRDFLRWKAAA